MGRPPLRFEDQYIAIPEAGCWVWLGGLDADGYGCMSHNRKAHRVSYERHVGAIPPGQCVCHRCDVRCCVNHSHLFVGSNLENHQDKVSKGRQIKGERARLAKLTETQVTEIIASPEPCFVLAMRYGVSDTAISFIKLGKTWKHISRPEGYIYTPYRAPGNHQRWSA